MQQEGHRESKKSVITRLHKRDKRYNNKESDCANRIRNQAVHHWTVFDWIILLHFPLCQINVQKVHQNTNYRVRGVKQTSVINNCIFVSFDVTVAIAGIRARNRLGKPHFQLFRTWEYLISSAQDFSDQVQLSSAFLRKGPAQLAQLR